MAPLGVVTGRLWMTGRTFMSRALGVKKWLVQPVSATVRGRESGEESAVATLALERLGLGTNCVSLV